MFSLICVLINGWVNNRETGDLRRHRGHYDVIVMKGGRCFSVSSNLSRLDNSPKRIGMRWLLKPSQGCDDILQLVRLDRIPQRICLYITREPGPVFYLLLRVSSDYAQPITGQVTEVTCPVIGWAQPELTPSKRQKMGPDHALCDDRDIVEKGMIIKALNKFKSYMEIYIIAFPFLHSENNECLRCWGCRI